MGVVMLQVVFLALRITTVSSEWVILGNVLSKVENLEYPLETFAFVCYEFSILLEEFAAEIAGGVFLKLRQVGIMEANAASQDPEKTIVLTDLVPLGETFDNTTAHLSGPKKLLYKLHRLEIMKCCMCGIQPRSSPSPPSTIGITLGVDVGRQHHRRGEVEV
ncbi:hypothetical protein ACH5RR_006145 [Cinchona calisaya]|uniref:Receptor-like PK ALE2 N-terminal domain-containing protein n=1 Tax=Cinchona calisaya TaxID=153742 RepID=A0ABD3ANH2_9GENT